MNNLFCELWCRSEKTNNKKTTWIIQKLIKTNFSNELEKNNSFFTEQTILLNERFSELSFTEKTNDILRSNEFYDWKKRTKCIVHEQWMNEMKKAKTCSEKRIWGIFVYCKPGMRLVLLWKSWCHEVAVVNGLHLVRVEPVQSGVEGVVDDVQDVDHLYRVVHLKGNHNNI